VDFAIAALTIIAVNLVLSGDNGIAIAVALRPLPRRIRVRALATAAACDVSIRVCATFFAAQLLRIWFLRLAGGIFVLFLSARLIGGALSGDLGQKTTDNFWKAVWLVLVADITMCTDNVLAVAAVAQGNLLLLVLGLGVSIPCVFFCSNVLSVLLDRYRVLLYLGAALLAKIGADMIATDPLTVELFRPSAVWRGFAEAFAVTGVLGTAAVSELYKPWSRSGRDQRHADASGTSETQPLLHFDQACTGAPHSWTSR
jgi:YjbE family integral membrane protein